MNDRAVRIRKAAHRWFVAAGAHVQPEQVNTALSGCAEHLREAFQLSPVDADDIALSAWSELEGQRTACYIDLELSTPFLVFVVDPVAKVRHPFPLVDLVQMIGPRVVR